MNEEASRDTSFVNQPGKGYAIASLALGVIGLLVLISGMPFISLILGIVGVAMASVATRTGYSGGMSIAGRVLSWISIIIGIIITILFFLMIGGLIMFGGAWMRALVQQAETIQSTTSAAVV